MPLGRRFRVEFTKEHDDHLTEYLAIHCPSKEGRSGFNLYQRLVDNADDQWPWSTSHTVHSWRERYVKKSDLFDRSIRKYQRKHKIQPADPARKRKRISEPIPPPTPIELLAPSLKRARREEEEEECVPEARPASQRDSTSSSKSKPTSKPKPTSKSIPKRPRDPPETPPQPPRKSKHTHTPGPSPSNTEAPTNVTKKPDPDPTAVQTQDTIEILSSPEEQPPPPPTTDNEPDPGSSPRHVTRIKVRVRTPSDLFASESPSSPRDVPPVVRDADPSSQPQSVPSAPGAGIDGSPIASAIYLRAPPRVVDVLHGQVLVDREGNVPRTLAREEEEEAKMETEMEEEKEKEGTQWPPVRGTAKQRRTGEPDVEVHHPFSQFQTQVPPEALLENVATDERDQGTINQPGLDQCTVAAGPSGQLSRDAAQAENERREDVVQNGASPVKRVVTTAASPDPFVGTIQNVSKTTFKFPAPRTRIPFQAEPPVAENHPSPQPLLLQPRPSSRTRTAPTRDRRLTLDHVPTNGNGRKHRRNRDPVPSVDLVAFSRSTPSARSHSRSSAATSALARAPRWSLPTMPVFDERQDTGSGSGSVSGSGSLFRWTAPSPMLHNVQGSGTSIPRFMLTSSPVRSASANGNGAAARVHVNGIPTPPISLAPHPSDLDVAARHGLAMMLAQMSSNHGLALGVVEEVYRRVGGLRETDEVLRGMREAAEGYGEQEIERRVSGRQRSVAGRGERRERESRDAERRTQLRYVMASEDGEDTEYSPPETSQAAMWKRQSESASFTHEEEEEGHDEDDDEVEEGRAVEEELFVDEDEGEQDEGSQRARDIAEDVPPSEGDPRAEKRVIEALLEDTRFAQELEKKMGKGRYRRHIASLFTGRA